MIRDDDQRLPTLNNFLDDKLWNRTSRSAYVTEEGFDSLYVRIGPLFMGGMKHDRVFTIANVTVTHKGIGTVWMLIDRILCMGLPVQVECVHNPCFAEKLTERGFTVMNTNCYWKVPRLHHGDARIPITDPWRARPLLGGSVSW